ncbi:MAG: hypothetical protein ABI895_22450 [Deltaproteobacteria bacterium]
MRWLAWLISGAAFGCSVLPDTASDAPQAPLTCADDSECRDGHCLTAFGVCSQPEGELSRLLFEVTPPASDPVYGGARFLTIADLSAADLKGVPGRGIEAGWIELNVLPRVPVSGSVQAPDQAACLSMARTLPVTLTFTPSQRLFGLPVPSYDLTSGFDESTGEYTFRGSLPPGNYDVYMRPDTAALSEDCIAIPQIFHNQQIGNSMLRLEQQPPAPLQLTILGDDNHDGWVVDMVHPVTGELISNRVRLSAANRDPVTNTLRAKLYYSTEPKPDPPESSDAPESTDMPEVMLEGEELVRLTPPPNVAAGTVFLQRSGIELATSGEGQIGDVFKFGKPVQYRAWVWKERAFDSPVPAIVSFAARELDEVADGIPTSFESSARVDPRGQVQVSLLPGRYRVRVTPPGIDLANLGLLSSSESSITVWPNELDDPVAQGGHVIEVHAAVYLGGRVVADAGGQPLAGVEVRADAASSIQGACMAPTKEQPAPPCDRRARTAVLRKALAQDPFIPRTRNALSGSDGGFVIDGLDCSQCEPGAGARFDLSVRPPPEMRLPWLVVRGNDVYLSQTRRSALRVPQPVAHAMRLTYGDPTPIAAGSNAGGVVPGLAGALIRVYALIDEQTKIVSDAESSIPCVTIPDSPGRRCVQSVLQVAELRSGSDGEFLLLLPPNLD